MESRPDADPELHGRVEMLAERLERMESKPAEGHFRADLENQARTLDDLGSIVDDLRARPTGAPDLDERLASIECRLEATAGGQGELAEQLGALVDHMSDRHDPDARIDGLVEQLGALDTRLDAALNEMEGVRSHLAGQDDTVVDGRLDDLGRTLEVLRGEIADIATSSAQPDAAISERLEDIAARTEIVSREATESREAAGRIAVLEERLRDGFVTPDVLTRSIEWALNERAAPATEERIGDLFGQIDALRSDLASRHVADERRDAEIARLNEIEARIQAHDGEQQEETALADRLAALERARTGDLDTVEVLARAMDRIRQDLTERPRDDVPGAAVLDAMSQLAQRIETLEVTREEERAAATRSGPDASELVSELGRVRLVLERIGLHLGEHDRAIAELSPARGAQERLDDLTSLVESLATSPPDRPVMIQPSSARCRFRRVGTICSVASRRPRSPLGPTRRS